MLFRSVYDKQNLTLTLFYCQNVPGSSEQERQAPEREYGDCIRLFPITCSGRLEPVHLLRALEEFADVAYVITCPQWACRYFEGIGGQRNGWKGPVQSSLRLSPSPVFKNATPAR